MRGITYLGGDYPYAALYPLTFPPLSIGLPNDRACHYQPFVPGLKVKLWGPLRRGKAFTATVSESASGRGTLGDFSIELEGPVF